MPGFTVVPSKRFEDAARKFIEGARDRPAAKLIAVNRRRKRGDRRPPNRAVKVKIA